MVKSQKHDSLSTNNIANKHGLRLLVMFGSQVLGGIHKESDLDLAFHSFKEVDEQKLYEDLSRYFKRADIDLINLSTTHNHILRFEILSKCKVLFEFKKGLCSKMTWESYFDYIDFQSYYKLRSKLIDEKLAKMGSA